MGAQIIIAPAATGRKDFRFEGGSHEMRVPLAPHCRSVRPGTPLKPTPLGWDIALDIGDAKAIAVVNAAGGTRVHARTSATFDTHIKQFIPGTLVCIKDIDDTGFVTFEITDGDSKLYPEDDTKIHMTV